ncbi:glycosyltransferase involved in cell wall biosynthesis [Actinoplanes octamycinicus]|uniref:Glycosyltransferase involved in cell wall biosynthesis n=1 Tax=Actinoplanes octamycinicus TaxID=135948 RepID=A0A7W7H6V3_9ACTN|nr:glycosyltransferase [Actinoplanes octamycinicus]MBB4744968.1 glycosyltransferase involved in cell wall biosynthesis [Actinoplanes octamycinicus]GIE55554.1 glycosyl transferase [Actinoplanes octamycinicus]
MISTAAEGSAEHQLRLLLRRLPHDSEVVTLSPPGTEARAIRAGGIPVHELSTACDRDLAAILRLRRLIRRGRFDLVHTHLYRACVQGRIAARLAGVPHIVATEHHLGRAGATRLGPLYLVSERLGQMTIAATAAIADRLRGWGVPDHRIATIPRAIDPAEFRFDPALRAAARARLGVADHVPVIGVTGRLTPAKRFDLLIRAVAEVPGAVLLLVGDGPARPALAQLAIIEGVADRVLFAGAVRHPREMLCAMDIFACPDRNTWGLAVLEAIAAGLPAVYAACPPLEERAAGRAPVRATHRLSPHDRESLPRTLRAEVLCHRERRGVRLPARTAGLRYDADHLAAAVGQVYDRLTPTAPLRGCPSLRGGGVRNA